MNREAIIDLHSFVSRGELFRPHNDSDRIESYIPSEQRMNHAGTLVELQNGDLLCTWMGGSEEGAPDMKIYMSRLNAGSSQWTKPTRLSEDFNRSEQNPAIFEAPDGKLWLTYCSLQSRGCSRKEWETQLGSSPGKGTDSYIMPWTSAIMVRTSVDRGVTWDAPRVLIPKSCCWTRMSIMELSNGDWMLPMYYRTGLTDEGTDYSAVQISSDQGRTWSEYEVPESIGKVHASVLEIGNGNLLAFYRSRASDFIYMNRSYDYGRSWSPPERSALPNNNSSIAAVKLPNGHIAMVYNHCSTNTDPSLIIWHNQRLPVTVALSEDEGITWPYQRHIETGENYSGERNRKLNQAYGYPHMLQAADGSLHIVHSCKNSIHPLRYLVINERWIKGSC